MSSGPIRVPMYSRALGGIMLLLSQLFLRCATVLLGLAQKPRKAGSVVVTLQALCLALGARRVAAARRASRSLDAEAPRGPVAVVAVPEEHCGSLQKQLRCVQEQNRELLCGMRRLHAQMSAVQQRLPGCAAAAATATAALPLPILPPPQITSLVTMLSASSDEDDDGENTHTSRPATKLAYPLPHAPR